MNREKLQQITSIIQSIHFPFLTDEYQIHRLIAAALSTANIRFQHEYKLGSYARIDFFVEGIGIEVKTNKADRRAILAQLKKYAAYDAVYAIIVVVQRAMKLPAELDHKAIISIPVYRSWGISNG